MVPVYYQVSIICGFSFYVFFAFFYFSVAGSAFLPYTNDVKMLPLIDGAGYKLFDAEMLSLTDGARNKLFGAKMFCPALPVETGHFYLGGVMKITEGYFYHIKDSYFSDVDEATLMSNHENGGYRPHFFAIRDAADPCIFWMVPVSSRFGKYRKLHDSIVAKYRRCTKIVLGKCGGTDAAFLVQNAFPVTEDYLDHIHTINGEPLTLHKTTAENVIHCLNGNLRLHKRGVNLFFADIDRLYGLMSAHLHDDLSLRS